MCTLALLLGVSRRFPLIVAANRDEFRGRPSTQPELWSAPAPILAGRDLRAGGTWLGVNAHGLVAGLTNLWNDRSPDPQLASRGAIVLGLLEHSELDAARAWIDAQPTGRTNPFLAVCADRTGRAFWVQDEARLQSHALSAGIFVFGNSSPHAATAKPQAAARNFASCFARRHGESAAEILAALRPALATHSEGRGPRDSICVHAEGDFGTVSASCILIGPDESAYFHAAGAPCETKFDSFSQQLTTLLAG